MSYFDAAYDRAAALRHQYDAVLRPIQYSAHQCPFVANNATHALASSATVNLTFNYKEEYLVIHSGWTPEEEESIVDVLG